MITVKELKELLDEYDDDRIVVIAIDDDGNSCSPLDNVSWGVYFSETEWTGDFVDSDELAENDKINTEEAEPAILLWPAN